jgi:hypothetical protein
VRLYGYIFALAFALTFAGCANGLSNPLSSGGISGQSAITLSCPDGKSTVTYTSGALLPQTNPVTATCTSGGQTNTASVTGIDLQNLITAVKAGMAGGAVP